MTDDTMELTHYDLVEALDRIMQQLDVIDNSAIFSKLNVGLFDPDEVKKVLALYKNKVVVDAHQKGFLEWK